MDTPEVSSWLGFIKSGNRNALAKALTLLESTKAKDRRFSHALLKGLRTVDTDSFRIAVTGAPGVGKSSFIDQLGVRIRKEGLKLAVLSIDPSSGLTHGSILGDKTRMLNLVQDPEVFIRPSPAGDFLGGVNPATGDSIRLLEAAGYEIILVETVGIGQSEISVVNLCDLCLYLHLPNAGDDLQAIKKGVLERADFWIIHKADRPDAPEVARTHKDLLIAQSLQEAKKHGYKAKIYLVSSLLSTGIEEIWRGILDFRQHVKANDYLYSNRKRQLVQQFNEKWPREIISMIRYSESFAAFEKETAQKLIEGDIGLEEALDSCRNFIFAGLLNYDK